MNELKQNIMPLQQFYVAVNECSKTMNELVNDKLKKIELHNNIDK